MVGLGTLINMAAIAAGGTAGLVFRRYLSKSLQTNLMSVMGLVCMFLGTAGTLSHAPRFRHRTRADIDRRDDDGDFFYGRNADRHHPEA